MKPAAFRYHRPRGLAEVLAILAQVGDEGKLIAGGQSLVPLMNMRLARPAHLVDLNGAGELSYLRVDGGELAIGALTRWVEVERSPAVSTGWPLLVDAIREVGHFQIRNRGTLGGSAAHADPAAELPAVLLAVGARLVLESHRGRREVVADDFFQGILTTALAVDEVLVELRLPPMPAGAGHGFAEFARRPGDFALAGAVCVGGPLGSAPTLVVFGVGGRPVRLRAPARDGGDVRALLSAAAEEIDVGGDVHGSAEWKRRVVAEMAARAYEGAIR